MKDLPDRFAREMDRLGPFEPQPRLAVAVSGGADSMALVLLAREWVHQRGGTVLALTVDHGLRAESAMEADVTLRRLADRGIPGRKLHAQGLMRGPGLAERAREARYGLVLDACAADGIAHLLLGHHRGDQAETVMMRVLSASGTRGLAGMPGLMETRFTRLLRPLLDVAPDRLRAWLSAQGMLWVEDPSNRDPAALRARLRAVSNAEGTRAVANAARVVGERRRERDREVARTLARRATIRPEGYALLSPGPIDPEALAALLRTIAGAPHTPPIDRVASLARSPRPATLGGVRIMAAGRLGPGWLLVRERRAVEGPVPAHPNAIWDGRFRLTDAPPDTLTGLTIAALGADAVRFRDRSGPPASVLLGLPTVRLGGMVIVVPHIGVGDPRWRLMFDPRNPASGAPFLSG
jgi:tRNA(Ile)-lysidine synthase